MNIYTNKFNAQQVDKVKQFFEINGAVFSPLQYAKWKATGNGYIAGLYNSGKFVLQGKDVYHIAKNFEQYMGFSTIAEQIELLPYAGQKEVQEIFIDEYIGTDESGKGDFFGPLVVAGVYVNVELAKKFKSLGIKDSKKLDDNKIIKLSAEIKNSAPYSIVVIMPEKYNELYNSFKNLNKLLAWGHARAIENVLNKQKCNCALSDKFGDESLIQNALMKNGQKIRLEQRTKGESYIAVAAASVIARAEFVKRCEELSNIYKIAFPKGASDKVVDAAQDFVLKYGKEKLQTVAKMHFKTTSRLNF